MAFKFKGSVKILGAYDVNTKRPLDNRNVVQKVEDLYKIEHFYSYEGMPVVVVEEGNIYVLLDDNKRSSPEGWKRIGGVDIEGDVINLQTFVRNQIETYVVENSLDETEVKLIFENVFNK
jgi:hypothetical protein